MNNIEVNVNRVVEILAGKIAVLEKELAIVVVALEEANAKLREK